MSHRRVLARVPLETPVVGQNGQLDETWKKYFTTVNDMVYKYDIYAITLNPTSVSANTTSEQTFTVPGVASNDYISVTKPTHTAGLGIVNVRASAKNQIAITFMNNTGSPIDPPAEIYTIKVEKI